MESFLFKKIALNYAKLWLAHFLAHLPYLINSVLPIMNHRLKITGIQIIIDPTAFSGFVGANIFVILHEAQVYIVANKERWPKLAAWI